MKNKRTHVLERAIALVDGDRNKTYGDPTENHTRIAARWSITLGVHVEPWQVPLMMADLKIDRYANCPGHEDSAVDGAAYLAISHEVWQKEHLPEMGATSDTKLVGVENGETLVNVYSAEVVRD